MAENHATVAAGLSDDEWQAFGDRIERAIGALYTIHQLAARALNESEPSGDLIAAICDVTEVHGAGLDRAYQRIFKTPGVGCFADDRVRSASGEEAANG